MTCVYLNLTRFCLTVPYTLYIEKKLMIKKSFLPKLISWACNPKCILNIFFGPMYNNSN